MTRVGFSLDWLRVTGDGVPDANVVFTDGLNVIVGPSDTGKTFIAQCIGFMFGASTAPKEIPEAEAYTTVAISLRARSNEKRFVLERSLRGGKVQLRTDGQEDRVLAAQHKPNDENTVSHFLLELSGFKNKRVQTSQRGSTRPLSFRDVRRLSMIDEETVISEKSPVHSGQNTDRPVEGSVFRLLLTGVDDSSVVEEAHPKIRKGREEGRTEFVEILRERIEKQLAGMNLQGDVATFRQELERVDALFEAASAELAAEQETVAVLEGRRRSAWASLRKVESRLSVLSELQERFELLKKQYSSDLKRLDSISEAGVGLDKMKEERCPVCGALAEHHEQEHQDSLIAPGEVARACLAEAGKTRTLLSDLQSTLAQNAAEVEQLSERRNASSAELKTVGAELRERVQPRLQAALEILGESQTQRDRLRDAIQLHERAAELEHLLDDLAKSEKTTRSGDVPSEIGADKTEQFSKEVENLLRAWRFPNLDRVIYSEKDHDIVISGRKRASHGKGVRAITHAAFNLAILRYCVNRSMPHPGLVLIDSPLVVYREPDSEESEFAGDVKTEFYRSLAAHFNDSQVIILENEDPPDDIDRSANIIRFTGAEHGRRGFIPQDEATTGKTEKGPN